MEYKIYSNITCPMRGWSWWWWWWWWWIVFVVWLTDERCLALFPARTTARNPHYRESPTRGEQDNISNGKYWRRPSLIRNLLNVKHYAPSKLTHWKYQIIKILENCFQKINYFPWIKLNTIWIHLKYWHYSLSHLELLCLPHYPCHILSYQLKSLFNTILIMFFIGFPILSYAIRPYAITIIG